jgi:hypothetical protein
MKQDYMVRAYKEGDEKEINTLFNLIFNKNRSLNEWYWLFRDNLNSSRNLTSIAEAEGKIIASPNVPGFCKFKDDIVMVGQPVDNPSSRFRGNENHQDITHRMIPMQVRDVVRFGFPNERYYKVGKMAKYGDICPILIMFKS